MQDSLKKVFGQVPCWFSLHQMTSEEMIEYVDDNNFFEIIDVIRNEKNSIIESFSLEHCVIFLTLLRQSEEAKNVKEKLLLTDIAKNLRDYEKIKQFHDKLKNLGFCIKKFDGFCYNDLQKISGKQWAECFS